MISLRYSDLVHGPVHVLLCGIPVQVSISERNPCSVTVRLSCVHAFQHSHGMDAEIATGNTYVFEYKDLREELHVGRQFIITDAD